MTETVHRAQRYPLSRRQVIQGSCTAAAAAAALGAAGRALAAERMSAGFLPAHEPIGRGIGVHPGRVVWARDPKAVNWNDGSRWWWSPSHFSEPVIAKLLNKSLLALAGEAQPQAAWEALLQDFHARTGRKAPPRKQAKVAIKLNMNGSGAYSDALDGRTQESYGSAVLLKALLTSLVRDAGFSAHNLCAYDAGRLFPQTMQDYCSAGMLKGVQFRHRRPGEPDDAAADLNAPLRWSSPVHGAQSFLPRCVTEADYLINLANLKGHCYGLTLCAKNHFGSFVNESRDRAPQAAGLHSNVWSASAGDYSVLADLIAHRELGGKTVLYLLDGLLTATGESVSVTPEAARWSMPPMSGGFCASLFLSQDPVAIDSVGADFLTSEPEMLRRNSALRGNAGVENYLHEAALAGNAPSGTPYQDGFGRRVGSLGVHDHWDGAETKRYGRNLGRAEGIELIALL